MSEYKLSYTAEEINEKLGKIDTIEEQVNNLSDGNVDLTGVVKSVNGKTPDEKGNVNIETDTAYFETFDTPAKNLLNPATITHGVYVNWTNGNLSNNANCSTSDYISVSYGDVLVGSWVNADGQNLSMKIRYYGFYDADKNFVSGSSTAVDALVVPDGVAYVRVTLYTSTYNTDSLQIEKTHLVHLPPLDLTVKEDML